MMREDLFQSILKLKNEIINSDLFRWVLQAKSKVMKYTHAHCINILLVVKLLSWCDMFTDVGSFTAQGSLRCFFFLASAL